VWAHIYFNSFVLLSSWKDLVSSSLFAHKILPG
jgi:hypothetical protein